MAENCRGRNGERDGVGKRLAGQSDLEASRLTRKAEEKRLVWRRTMLIMALLMSDCSDLNELLMLLMHNLYASMARGVQCKSCLMKRWICACRCLKFWAFLQDAEEKPHHGQKAYGGAFRWKSPKCHSAEIVFPDLALVVNCFGEQEYVLLPVTPLKKPRYW